MFLVSSFTHEAKGHYCVAWTVLCQGDDRGGKNISSLPLSLSVWVISDAVWLNCLSCEWMIRLQHRDTSPQHLSDAALGFHSSGDKMGSLFRLKGTVAGGEEEEEDAAGITLISHLYLFHPGHIQNPACLFRFSSCQPPALWSTGMMDLLSDKGEGGPQRELWRVGGWRGACRIKRGKGKMKRGGWEDIKFTVGSAGLYHIRKCDALLLYFLEHFQWLYPYHSFQS